MNNYHTSVLLQQTIDLLNVQKGSVYIDGTLGGGGHSLEILKRGGRVLALDIDQDAIDYVQKTFGDQKGLTLAKGNFKDIDRLAQANGVTTVAGIIFDLGVSSHHFDVAQRGFSVQKDGPLDMRMDLDLGVKAADLINILTKGELYELFTKFGEEHHAYAISSSIVRARQIKRIETTSELVNIVRRSVPRKAQTVNPATRVFQALRIVVNDELNNIKEALPKAVTLLQAEGRLAIISFHSLEDRIIKNTFKDFEEKDLGTIITHKPIVPHVEELAQNNRSRSAKLRVFEKK
jgi:16S rRNA (cytosine1402-N4)-methyltransferase